MSDKLNALYAVVDIGTRAGRMLIARGIHGTYDYEIIHKMSEVLSIGLSIKDNMMDMNSKHIIKLIYFLQKVMKHIKEYNITQENILIIGTEAFRKSKNLQLILHLIYRQTKVLITVLSPQDESHYALQSSLSILAISDNDNNLIMDIGGGSVEIVIVTLDNQKQIIYKDWISIPVGIMLPKIRGHAKYVAHHMRNIITYNMQNFLYRNQHLSNFNIIGIKSSFFQIAARILKKKSIPSNQQLKKSDVVTNMNILYQQALDTYIESINDIINIRSIVIVKTILDMIDFQNLYISNYGLLHGVIRGLIEKNAQDT